MDTVRKSKVPTLCFGDVLLELHSGDVLNSHVNAFCCSSDDLCSTSEGLFGVLTKDQLITVCFPPDKKRLIMGDVMMLPTKGLMSPHVILISVFNERYGNIDRQSISTGFGRALALAERSEFQQIATPFLGRGKSRIDTDIVWAFMIKSVREFANTNPKFLRCIQFYAFSENVRTACERHFFTFSQQQAGS